MSCRVRSTATVVCGAWQEQLLRLQRVQNTAAEIATQTKKSDHITPILSETLATCWNVHWQRNMSLLYSCMNGAVSQHLWELIPLYLPVRHLRSFTSSHLRIPSDDQGNNKNTLESERFPMLHPDCWTVCPFSERTRKTRSSTCSQKQKNRKKDLLKLCTSDNSIF